MHKRERRSSTLIYLITTTTTKIDALFSDIFKGLEKKKVIWTGLCLTFLVRKFKQMQRTEFPLTIVFSEFNKVHFWVKCFRIIPPRPTVEVRHSCTVPILTDFPWNWWYYFYKWSKFFREIVQLTERFFLREIDWEIDFWSNWRFFSWNWSQCY